MAQQCCQALGCRGEGAEQCYQALGEREEPLWLSEAFLSAVLCLPDKQGEKGEGLPQLGVTAECLCAWGAGGDLVLDASSSSRASCGNALLPSK